MRSGSQHRPQTIGVIGGGSAGYLSALYLKKSLPDVQVTLIESSRIPVIGVGESTTPIIVDFLHRVMGFSVPEFLRETKSTLKLGIKFLWGLPDEDHFNSPFGSVDPYNALFHTGNVNNNSLTSMLMEQGLAPVVAERKAYLPLALPTGCAYHIDNRNFLAYLRGKLTAIGVEYIDAEIDQVTLKTDGSGVQSVVSTEQDVYSFDLFVDSSGFRSLLLEKSLGAGWVSYSSSLKTNRAVIGTRPNMGEIEPFTTAATLKHGWLWTTPMQTEDHLGYVFCSDFCSDDEARTELAEHCREINNERVISFRTGRHDASWLRNVVAIGNSFAFIEPLESTAIHMILWQLRGVRRVLDGSHSTESYNENVNAVWDHLRWFIALHYKFNRKLDTPFWKMCRAQVDVSGVTEYIDYFSQSGPLSRDDENPLHEMMNRDAIFTVFSFDMTMTGCGVNREFFQQKTARVKDNWPLRLAFDRGAAQKALGHREALRVLQEGGCDLLQVDQSRTSSVRRRPVRNRVGWT